MLDFLTSLFNAGLGYSAINTARSALSSYLGNSVGSSPVVIRHLRGVFNLRPALPRTGVSWDVDPVLDFLKTLAPANSLSLKDLSQKLALLIALLAGQRGQSVHLMDIRNMTLTPNRLSIRFGDSLKQSRPGAHQEELHFKAYAPDRRLCVINYCNIYLKRTAPLRKGATKLFISCIKPHGPVSRDTVSRWIRDILQRAGVNMDVFTPHSTRAAAVSAAVRNKTPLQTILRTAGWSGESTFRTYYHKPIMKCNTLELRKKQT